MIMHASNTREQFETGVLTIWVQELNDLRELISHLLINGANSFCIFILCFICRINEVKWDGQDIVILDTVTIKPPYAIENCSGREGDNTLTHVRKIVSTILTQSDFYIYSEKKKLPRTAIGIIILCC